MDGMTINHIVSIDHGSCDEYDLGMRSSMGSRNTPEYQAAAEKSCLIPEMIGFLEGVKSHSPKTGRKHLPNTANLLGPR